MSLVKHPENKGNLRWVGITEALSHLQPDSDTQLLSRIAETGGHFVNLPKCRSCHQQEECLETGPRCADVRKEAVH